MIVVKKKPQIIHKIVLSYCPHTFLFFITYKDVLYSAYVLKVGESLICIFRFTPTHHRYP